MKLEKMLQSAYEKYRVQTDNPDAELDYREEIADVVSEAICCGVSFQDIAKALSELE